MSRDNIFRDFETEWPLEMDWSLNSLEVQTKSVIRHFQALCHILPTEIIGYAQIPFDVFEAKGNDSANEHLGLWTYPYSLIIPQLPQNNLESDREAFRSNLESSQWSALVLTAFQRIDLWQKEETSDQGLAETVETELNARIESWWQIQREKGSIGLVQEVREVVREVALEWGARAICVLADEWEMRKHGRANYQEAARQQKTPWLLYIKQALSLSL